MIGVLISFERLDADAIDVFGGLNGYFQMWGLYRFGMVLLVVAPLFIGLATVIVPMQVGSSNIAFPRAALAAAWGYVFGAIVTVVSVLAGGGWGALDGVTGDEADAIELTLLGTGIVIVSILLASVCLATTVISLRTPGMGLAKVPLFAWSMLVAGSVWVLTLPVAIANIAILYIDLSGGAGSVGAPNPSFDVYAQRRILDQPAVCGRVPVLGIAGSIIPVVAKGRQVSHEAMMILIGLAACSPSAAGPSRSSATSATRWCTSPSVLPPSFPARLARRQRRHARRRRAPLGIPPAHMIGALGSMLLFLAATAAGALRVIDPLDQSAPPPAGVLASLRSPPFSGARRLVVLGTETDGRLFSRIQGLGAMTFLLLGGVLLGATDVIAGFVDTPDVLLASDDSLGDAMIVLSMIGSSSCCSASSAHSGRSPWPASSRARPTTTHGADTPSSGPPPRHPPATSPSRPPGSARKHRCSTRRPATRRKS